MIKENMSDQTYIRVASELDYEEKTTLNSICRNKLDSCGENWER